MSTRNMIGLVYNSRVANAADFVRDLADSLGLGERGWVCSAVELEDARDRLERTSLIVVAGGDGTILRTVRVIAPFGIPIVGINMGRVGFMTELKVEEALTKLPAYLDGSIRVEERMMVEASVIAHPERTPRLTIHALNDIVVGRGSIARLLDIDTAIDGVPLTSYRADAVIISTATGSTGYALSAGGPIIYPENRVMLLQPVAPHTGLGHGLILPQDSVIEIRASNGHEAVLSVDGFPETALQPNDTVTIKRSPYVARFLRAHPPNTFYAALMRRLGLERHRAFAEDPR